MIELKLFGGAIIEVRSEALGGPAAHRHSLALLALLACAPGRRLDRGRPAGVLWPESPERVARNRLGTCVHRLRGAIGAEVLTSVGASLRLEKDLVECDVLRFGEAREAGDWAEAVAQYGGPFLDGFWLPGSPEFERWAEGERDRLAREFRESLEHLAEAAHQAGEANAAVRWWRRRSREDPTDSRVTIRLMEALATAGNRAEALRVAQLHATMLDEELGAGPNLAVRELAARLTEQEGGGTPIRVAPGSSDGTRDLDDHAIAVLPFEELGSNRTLGAFADGLHHDLLTRLSRVASLTVISRTSVLRYRNRTTPIPQIARELGVGTILEGGIQYANGRVRLNVQLIDARRDVHRWAETYDRELIADNLFDIQSELAGRIAGSLRARPSRMEKLRLLEWAPTASLEAYRLHAEGRVRLDERTESGMRRAVALFREAIREDPEFALAWVGLTNALALLYEYGYEPLEPGLAEAEEAVARARALDPHLAAAHTSLGLLHEARREGPAAIRELARATQLEPSDADAHNWMSWTYQLLGRGAKAFESSTRAVRLNPLAPEVVDNLAVTTLVTGDPRTALREARRARSLQPDETSGAFYEALALVELGRLDAAAEILRGLQVPWAGSGPLITLALVHAMRGDRAEAKKLLKRFETSRDHFGCAMVYAALGKSDRSFESLGRVQAWDYWPTLAMHFHYPEALGSVRADPRFTAVIQRVNLAWGLNADGGFPVLDEAGRSSRDRVESGSVG